MVSEGTSFELDVHEPVAHAVEVPSHFDDDLERSIIKLLRDVEGIPKRAMNHSRRASIVNQLRRIHGVKRIRVKDWNDQLHSG